MEVAGDVQVPSDQASMSRNASALRPPASDSEIRAIAFLQAKKYPLWAGMVIRSMVSAGFRGAPIEEVKPRPGKCFPKPWSLPL